MADSYKALTRTYRPQTFDDIVSQEHVSSTLKNAIKQNRISHAYMFSGPRGVGKTTMARVLARTINSIDESVDGESLSQTLNIVEIDAASNNKVDDIHHLREVVRVPPQSGKYKIFIIDEVHMLSKSAFNALLKTLEEPPEHAIFIFATTEPHKVLPTILSRVQRFDFKRISVDEIVDRLRLICKKEDIRIDDESLHVIARRADGALRDALGLMDQAIAFCGTDISYSDITQALNIVGNDELFQFSEAVSLRDPSKGLLLIDRLLKEGVDILEFLVSLTTHFRNLYVAKRGGEMHLLEATAETKKRYEEAAGEFAEEDLMRMLHAVSEAQLTIRDVQQPRIHFEILMLKLVHMSRTGDLKTLLEKASGLKKKGHSPSVEKPGTDPAAIGNGRENRDHQPNQNNGSTPPEAEIRPDDQTGEQSTVQESDDLPAPESGKDTELDEFLTGRPSLGFAEGISTKSSAKSSPEAKSKERSASSNAINSLEDIEAEWKGYLDKVKKKVPLFLFEQVNRLQLKSLKGRRLTVSASNEFAVNMIEENQEVLASIFKEQFGTRIRFNCVVERREKKSDEEISPYERFKKLQKKDPHLRSIVEIFGAELEY